MIDELIDLLGADTVLTDPDRLAAHTTDWTGRWVGSTPAVVFPRSVDEVATLVTWCRDRSVALVPQGGNTGMVGGSVPLGGELVVNLTRMQHVQVDGDAGTLVAGAGATLASVQQAARDAGWVYGVDLGARDTATIGGTVATNAGGLHVIRHGDTRRQLVGVRAVTGTGDVVGDLRGLMKDNTGYHLPSMLCGSEGTLAIVTDVCVRLLPPAAETAVALLAFASEGAAIDAVGPIRRGIIDLQALELFFADGLALVCSAFQLARPFAEGHAAFLLLEVGGAEGAVDRLGTELMAGPGADAADVAVATTGARAAALWRYREAHTEAISRRGVPHKLDVTLPHDAMGTFIDDVRSLVSGLAPQAHTWLFGHAGDGNLHVNITGADAEDHALDRAVLELVAERGGSISAEHGIGRAKAADLHLNRSPADLALHRSLKRAFDPAGILNPGVLLTP